MILRIGIAEPQSENVVVESALDRKEDRIVLGFSTENDQHGEYYETETFAHNIALTTQKYKKIVET